MRLPPPGEDEHEPPSSGLVCSEKKRRLKFLFCLPSLRRKPPCQPCRNGGAGEGAASGSAAARRGGARAHFHSQPSKEVKSGSGAAALLAAVCASPTRPAKGKANTNTD